MLPGLLYHDSGQLQFVYRFSMDWLPMVLVSIVLGGVLQERRRLFACLLVPALVLNLYGSWYFQRAPEQLFVTEPMGWPYHEEFE